MRLLPAIRISLLLYVLLIVAVGSWLTARRSTSWQQTLWVAVHPVNADGQQESARYMASLDDDDLRPVAAFIAREARRYGITLDEPVRVRLGEPVGEVPPRPPRHAGTLQVMLWSLQLRWWHLRVDRGADPPPADVTVYVLYHDPRGTPRLSESTGLRKGMIGVVNAFTGRGYAGANNVVIAHELLHTLGATDKYDPATNLPLYPEGYGEPDREPLYPQRFTEIMAGRRAQSPGQAEMPRSLRRVFVGPATAREIGWTD